MARYSNSNLKEYRKGEGDTYYKTFVDKHGNEKTYEYKRPRNERRSYAEGIKVGQKQGISWLIKKLFAEKQLSDKKMADYQAFCDSHKNQ